ncbi:FAD-binding oxidoreductase [Herbaspirillum sp. RV1423]|uniref:NAD(P)/FAD-dependent oxidoreductase n=1 Tax=Herbaspirillum sp. RV1423 TaxID=1443993 RepID=UPI0004BC49D3|nr:FAD-dependent oxidoreductase [Herbaspirillum sp. RV1423]
MKRHVSIRRMAADVVIVGGGIVGASAALALAVAGRKVVLLERDLCGSRSSGINYGGVRRQGRPPSQLPLAQRAHRIWEGLPELIGIDGEYVRSGHFKLARSAADMQALEAYAEISKPFGLGIELISGARLRAQCPWLGGAVVGGSLCPEDGQANPRLVAPAFARAAQRAGVQILERCEVREAGYDGTAFSVRAELDGEPLQVRAAVMINCAGAWAGKLAEGFGEAVPLFSGHPNMAVTEPIPHFLPWSLGVEGGSIYCRQVGRGNVVLGGGRGYAQDERRARSSHEAILSLLPQAVELLPALRHVHIIRTWSGVEGYLPDRQPVLGPSGTQAGLFHGFGFCGAGFQIGPAAGEVLAELILHGRSDTPIDAFSIRRFLPVADFNLVPEPERKIQ